MEPGERAEETEVSQDRVAADLQAFDLVRRDSVEHLFCGEVTGQSYSFAAAEFGPQGEFLARADGDQSVRAAHQPANDLVGVLLGVVTVPVAP
ncbi:hypothetical protein ADL27_40095 [Streptomyces sp. NRRL F-6602]|nr:hypothetical protein ADL27_40095 [Streptomyces sp. NRRL F-6602]